jgi:transposase
VFDTVKKANARRYTKMRREDAKNVPTFYFMDIENMVPKNHPLRNIRAMTDLALSSMKEELDSLYKENGRPCIPPEMLLRSLLLQMLYSIRSERLLIEQLEYNILFRWFVGLGPHEQVWDHSTYSKNRERFLSGDLARRFLAETVCQATTKGLMSDEHFTVDGTLIEAWASLKSLKSIDGDDKKDPPPDDPGNPTIDYRGEKRSNATHRSKTDAESRIARKGKGKESRLSFSGNVLMENRHGLVVDGDLRITEKDPERTGIIEMVERKQKGRTKQITVGGDKLFDEAKFIQRCRKVHATPHVAVKEKAGSGLVDERTLRHMGYWISQAIRKRVEEIFGWVKEPGRLKRTKHRGVRKVGWAFLFSLAIYNLLRMNSLQQAGIG